MGLMLIFNNLYLFPEKKRAKFKLNLWRTPISTANQIRKQLKLVNFLTQSNVTSYFETKILTGSYKFGFKSADDNGLIFLFTKDQENERKK